MTFEETTFLDAPERFEAGTPPIVEAIGLGAAVDYLEAIGLEAIAAHEAGLLAYGTERLSRVAGSDDHRPRARDKPASCPSRWRTPTPRHRHHHRPRRRGRARRPPLRPAGDGPLRTGRHGAGVHRLYNTRAEIDTLADSLGMVREIFG